MNPLPGVLKAPDHIVRALKVVQPNLEVFWNDKRERWVVYERRPGGTLLPVRVLEDTANDGAFVPLDMRAVEQAFLGDVWRNPMGLDTILDRIQRDKNRAALERRKRMADCSRAAVDTYWFRRKILVDMGRAG